MNLIFLAALHNNEECMKLLIDSGVKIDQKLKNDQGVDQTVFQKLVTLEAAQSEINKYEKPIELVLKFGASPDQVFDDGKTALHIAA
jgi:ankyrin repeat protein